MPRQPARPRRDRGSLTPDGIVAGAFEVARKVTLDQLSMPMLAAHLNVGVTSIYWHFRKKDELLNRMTEVAVANYLSQLPPIRGEHRWQATLREHFWAERRIHRDDEVLSDLLLVRTSTITAQAARLAFETVEAVLVKLVAAGFSIEDALMVHNSASVYTRGMILHDRILRRGDAPTLDRRQRRITDWSSMPLLASQLDHHPLAGTTDEDFEFGLDRLIAGYEALLRRTRASARRSPDGTRTRPR